MTEDNLAEQRQHEKYVDAAYSAIAFFHQQGIKKPAVCKVAEKALIGRATLYTDHPDWVEVRAVIAGKPSPRIKMAAIELSENQKWQRQLGQLKAEISTLGQKLKDIRNSTDSTYDKLLQLVHKYFILSKETPLEVENRTKIALDYTNLRERLERMEVENRHLRAERNLEGTVLPFSKKKVVDVYPLSSRSTLRTESLFAMSIDAINSLDNYFATEEFSPRVVYVMCGQFGSGKSRWIDEHKPEYRGTALYIDGVNHTLDMRLLIAKRIRKLKSDCRIICCRVFASVDDCLERNQDDTRKRLGLTVSDALIKQVQQVFEEVNGPEEFDAIEYIGRRP
ncbi:MAG: hypothetical protein ACLP29_15715 [Dissulfurispiraceae bacterium]